MHRISLIILAILFAIPAHSAQLTRTEDVNGWTEFAPESDTDVVYIAVGGNDGACTSYRTTDSEMGSNPFEPDGAVVPCETYGVAYALVGVGEPDWILFKRGETFTETTSIVPKGGESITRYALLGSYGASGASPIIKTRTNLQALRMTGLGSGFSAIMGLHFYAYTRDPDNPGYVAPGAEDVDTGLYVDPTNGGILVEGCEFEFYDDSILNGPFDGITIRRSVFVDNYAGTGQSHSQGLLIQNDVSDIILEDNVFDHNGWLHSVSEGGDGVATTKNHNVYTSGADGVLYTGNIFTRGSNMNNKFTANSTSNTNPMTVTNNLYVDGQQGIGLGNNTIGYEDFELFEITENVFANLGRSDHLQSIAWGIDIGFDSSGTLVDSNLIIHQNDATITNNFVVAIAGVQTNVTVSNNISYAFQHGKGMFISDLGAQNSQASTKTNVVFSDNYFQTPTNADFYADVESTTSGITFSGNKYYGDRAADDLFQIATTEYTLVGWQGVTSDNSTIEQVSFSDPTRSIETYQTSIGETATIDAFITNARAQDRYSWDTRYTAEEVNTWIRAGFFEAPTEVFTMGSIPLTQ